MTPHKRGRLLVFVFAYSRQESDKKPVNMVSAKGAPKDKHKHTRDKHTVFSGVSDGSKVSEHCFPFTCPVASSINMAMMVAVVFTSVVHQLRCNE